MLFSTYNLKNKLKILKGYFKIPKQGQNKEGDPIIKNGTIYQNNVTVINVYEAQSHE